ncbi:MAG: 30S ribosomal protein S6 [Parcubacteria group bacterium]
MPTEKRQYEISFLVRIESDKEAVFAALNKARAENLSEGKILEIKLAYPIKKQTSAFFGSAVFEAMPEDVSKIDESLKFADGVLRFLLVTPPAKKPTLRFASEEKTERGSSIETKTPNVDDKEFDEKLTEILTNTNQN